jgi:hypothetical protein
MTCGVAHLDFANAMTNHSQTAPVSVGCHMQRKSISIYFGHAFPCVVNLHGDCVQQWIELPHA